MRCKERAVPLEGWVLGTAQPEQYHVVEGPALEYLKRGVSLVGHGFVLLVPGAAEGVAGTLV